MTPYGTFTEEEWTMVKSAPMVAANLVVAADPSGPLGTMKEVMAAAQTIAAKNPAYGDSGLVAAVLADWEAAAAQAKTEKVSTTDFARQQMPQVPHFNSAEEMTNWAAESLAGTAAIVVQKAPEDVAGFQQWVMDSAVAAANAAKEGSFLGFGGKVVSDSEQAALARIQAILGL